MSEHVREWRFTTDLTPLPNQLMRFHWRKLGRIRDTIFWQVAAGMKSRQPMHTPITVEITRHSPKEPDPDAIHASAKFILDALVNLGCIPDDASEFVRLKAKWEKAGSRNSHTSVLVREALA